MPKVKVKKAYFDRVLDAYKEKVGEEFEVGEKRADALVEAGVCELVTEEQSEEAKEEAPEEKPKTRGRRSAK